MKDYFWDYTVMNLYCLGVYDIDYLNNSAYWRDFYMCARMIELKLNMTGCLDSELI